MPSILCYGDSNTWGSDPTGGPRFGPHVRWPGVMRDRLGPDYEVVEEGLPGRTTIWDNPIEEYRSGRAHIVPIVESHVPLDLIAILLGTNDVNPRYGATPQEIAQGAGSLARIAGRYAPHVLLIAPPPYAETETMTRDMLAISRTFGETFRQVAAQNGFHFLDAGAVIVSSPLDGIHWEADEHRKLGEAVAAEVQRIVSGSV